MATLAGRELMPTKDPEHRPSNDGTRFPLSERVAWSVEEAAASLGLCKRSFEDHCLAQGCPRLYAGRRLPIPRRPFEEWIGRRAAQTSQELEGGAEELLRAVSEEG